MDLNTHISDLTVGELLELIRGAVGAAPRTVRGIQGLADLFGVSYATAKRIKASGVIDQAVSQQGGVIVTDADLALRLWSRATHGRRKNTI